MYELSSGADARGEEPYREVTWDSWTQDLLGDESYGSLLQDEWTLGRRISLSDGVSHYSGVPPFGGYG